MKKLLILMWVSLLPIGTALTHNVNSPIKIDRKITIKELEKRVEFDTIDFGATVYTASEKETDSTPLITACGIKIDTNLLNKGRIRYIAVPQNWLKSNGGIFVYGQTIRVISDNWRFNGKFKITDCKNRRFKRSIDFLKPKHAFRIVTGTKGKWKGRKFRKYNYEIPSKVLVLVKR